MKRALICAAIAAACMTAPAVSSAAGGSSAAMQPYYDAAAADGEWGAVLNLNRLALEALDRGHPELAARALDASLARIDAIYAESASAAKARSLWSAEGVKDFKGEPYERAMAYYYRGLLYAAEGDYQNARASFRSAEYQDTISSNETYAGDFGLMSLLAGWASSCEGDTTMAEEFYQRAAAQQPGLAAPAAGTDTLVLVESGAAPVKATAGDHGEALVFARTPNPYTRVTLDGRELPALGDVSYQATTLGGRQVDRILNGKATFKNAANTAADIAMLGMQLAASSSDFTDLMGGSALVGIGAMLVGNATKPKADIRYWDNLPDRIHGEFLAPAKNRRVSLLQVDEAGNGRPYGKPVIDSRSGSCSLLVYRNHAPGVIPAQAANNLSERERRKVLKRNAERDRGFKAELQAMLEAEASPDSGLSQASR